MNPAMEAATWAERGQSAFGLILMIGIAWLLSSDRKRFPFRIVGWGLGLQLLFGVFVLRTSPGQALFSFLNDVVVGLLRFTDEGSRFLFGAYLEREFTVALNVLPTIIFFSSLMSVAYHLGIIQRVVRAVAWVMQKTLRTSGPETLSAAANIFVGQTEAPLLIRPFVAAMTRSELMAVMSGGFATVAGGVLAAYVGMLREHFPDIAGHLIAASVMSAPASLLIAKVMIPETESRDDDEERMAVADTKVHANLIDAAATGASDGLKLALNVGAMLLAFLALVALLNFLVSLPSYLHNLWLWRGLAVELSQASVATPALCVDPVGASGLSDCIRQAAPLVHSSVQPWAAITLQSILGLLLWPLAFAMGVPAADCSAVATLLGEKVILNEFVAYLHLAEQLQGSTPMGGRAITIVTYALCGFANLGSIGIQIAGIGGIAESRRADLARLGLRAMVAGTLAAFMTACVAGMLA